MRGRLYELPYGFPALVVPEADISATGTTDYLADAEVQARAQAGPRVRSSDRGVVYGDLLSFDDPEERLPAFDGLEGFHPGEESFYVRVLIPATLAETGMTVLTWSYVVESAAGRHLPGGRWLAP